MSVNSEFRDCIACMVKCLFLQSESMKQLTPEEMNRPQLVEYLSSEKLPVCIVLDHIRSGLNVGAIFRTCDAFAIDTIYICGITAKPPHAEIMKTALGATDSVRWMYVADTKTALEELLSKGFTLLPVEQTDQSRGLDQTDLTGLFPLALIFGNEMRGISPDVLAMCPWSLEIPQSGTKHSLNVATSAGIVLWECYRQNLLRRFLSLA